MKMIDNNASLLINLVIVVTAIGIIGILFLLVKNRKKYFGYPEEIKIPPLDQEICNRLNKQSNYLMAIDEFARERNETITRFTLPGICYDPDPTVKTILSVFIYDYNYLFVLKNGIWSIGKVPV